MLNIAMESYEIHQLEFFISRCRAEVEKRKTKKPFSEKDMECALSAHLSAHLRNKKNAQNDLNCVLRR